MDTPMNLSERDTPLNQLFPLLSMAALRICLPEPPPQGTWLTHDPRCCCTLKSMTAFGLRLCFLLSFLTEGFSKGGILRQICFWESWNSFNSWSWLQASLLSCRTFLRLQGHPTMGGKLDWAAHQTFHLRQLYKFKSPSRFLNLAGHLNHMGGH